MATALLHETVKRALTYNGYSGKYTGWTETRYIFQIVWELKNPIVLFATFHHFRFAQIGLNFILLPQQPVYYYIFEFPVENWITF